MAELQNWRYDVASDQKIRELSNRPHQLLQMIPKISKQPRTNYKKKLKSSFRLLLLEVLPTIHSTQLTPMNFSTHPFGLTGTLKKSVVKQDINIKWQVKTHSGDQQILQLCCAHPKTTKY